MNESGSYVRGAMTLLVSGVVVKVLGALFKIPLTNLIGDRGMGLFSFALQFFSLLFVVAASGLPIAESYLISEALALGRRRQARRVVVCAVCVFGTVALGLSAGLLLFSEPLSAALGEPDAQLCLAAVAPAVFFVTIEAALRGWYQGTGNMSPTAVSQVLESVGKLLIGLLLARRLLEMGCAMPVAAAGAVTGVTAGELTAMLYLAFCARRGLRVHNLRRTPDEARTPVLPRLVRLMVPVTLGAAVMTVAGFLDMAVLYRRLPLAGLDASEISAQYGAYSGMALTLFNLPQALSGAVAVSLLPALTAAQAKQNTRLCRRFIASSLRLTLLVCLPCGVGLTVFAQPLLELLFFAQPHGVAVAVPLLRILGFAEPLVGLAAVTSAILQALNRPDIPVYTMTAGCAIKIALSWVWIARPDVAMAGAPLGSIVCFAVILLCNLAAISHHMHGIPPIFVMTFKACAASVGMGCGAWLVYCRLSACLANGLAVGLSIAAAVVLYVLFLSLLGAWESEDILPLPGGQRLARLLHLTQKFEG